MSSFVAAFERLFASRRDVWAEGYPSPTNPDKYRYRRVDEELTPERLKEHLLGSVVIGVYPIMTDSSVAWFAVDFDGPADADNPFEIAYTAAKRQAQQFESAGMSVHLERSRSGNGVHLWGFLEEYMPAAVVRRAVRSLLLDDSVTLDRIYPVQNELTPQRPLGNLIALPFHGESVKQGNSVFLDAQGEPINPRTWLDTVTRIPAYIIDAVAGAVDAQDKAVMFAAQRDAGYVASQTGALKVLSSYGCRFFRHTYENRGSLKEPEWYAALQISAHFAHGRDLAHIISRGHAGYSEEETDLKFSQALANPKIGCQWIHENYPQYACEGCPMKAPHWLAKKPILELVGGQSARIARVAGTAKDIERYRRLDAGAEVSGIPTGLPGLDRWTRYRRAELFVVGARPSLGKTQLMIHSAVAVAKTGVPVYVFSAETGEQALRDRMVSHIARIDSLLLRGEGYRKLSAEEWRSIERASAELEELPIYVDYASLSADDILQQVEYAMLRSRADLSQQAVLFFDYLQFGSRLSGETRFEQITRASTEFKFLSKILNQTVVVFSQLRRDVEGDDDPDMSAFRESGQIEQDMDVGILIQGERVEGEWASRTLHIVKQRDGRANIKIPMRLNQTYGEWDYAGNPEVSERPLLDEVE